MVLLRLRKAHFLYWDEKQNYNQMIMICRNVLLTLLLLLGFATTEDPAIETIDITSHIVFPQIVKQKIPPKTINKLVFESVTESVQDINFELSAYLYMREGALPGDQIYNISNYGGYSSRCKVYKTDLELKQLKEFVYNVKPQDTIVMERNETSSTGVIASIFTLHDKGVVRTVDIVVVNQQDKWHQISIADINWFGRHSYSIVEKQSFTVSEFDPSTQFLQIEDRLYTVSKSTMSLQQIDAFSQAHTSSTVRNYVEVEDLIKVDSMEANRDNLRKRFFTFSSKEINIYEVVSPTEVSLFASIEDLKSVTGLRDVVYYGGYFYAVGLNSLYILDINNISDVKVRVGKLNGTCSHLQRFQSTLHLTCNYNKINYVLELNVLGFHISINRYYANEDIQGKAITRRVGTAKMAIMTDNDIRIMSYGLNKHVLLEYDNPQPEFEFGVRFGIQLTPVKVISNDRLMGMVLFSPEKLSVLQIEQIAPELYCEFPADQVGAEYQILMQFNTSRCSYIKREEEFFYGNIQGICQISVPYLIRSKQVQLEAKHSNIIMIILAFVLLGLTLLIAACAIKYNRSLETRFEKMQKKLEQMKILASKDKKSSI